ncbi:ATP-binding cassette domain-containing protein [Myxococcus stipitatus]|uniref:ATP-binding cassette domain-containing protein n=1 Tax=Myxococcus stipitatus TaxID=83455 RepID=UPI0030D428AB
MRRGDPPVLHDVRVTVGREDRVRIKGPNGAGKTTLLEALVGSLTRRERVLYLPQELSTAAKADAIERLHELHPEERGRVRSIFTALGSEPERVLRAEAAHLSPGEARKLVLAEALAQQVWALVMDEPTNHEAALEAYPGAVVLVTHDGTVS